jgi:hypothetical protein
MEPGQFDWLLPLALTLVIPIGFGIYDYRAKALPDGWEGTRLAYVLSGNAPIIPCFALFPALGQWLGHGDLLGFLVLVLSLGIIVACVRTRRRLDGREHAGFWDWLDLDI